MAALAATVLFGFGLALSDMMDPARVLGFLDLAGAFDPTLAFVLTGAVAVSALGDRLRRGMARPTPADRFKVPSARRLDPRLPGGAAPFGTGRGLAGLCPGSALSAFVLGLPDVPVFVAAMLGEMHFYRMTAIRGSGSVSKTISS